VVVCTCNSCPREAEAREYTEFEASLGYIARSCLKNKQTKANNCISKWSFRGPGTHNSFGAKMIFEAMAA
jgi:hypothetical protein